MELSQTAIINLIPDIQVHLELEKRLETEHPGALEKAYNLFIERYLNEDTGEEVWHVVGDTLEDGLCELVRMRLFHEFFSLYVQEVERPMLVGFPSDMVHGVVFEWDRNEWIQQ